jgi:flagellar P-ring protein FlgI
MFMHARKLVASLMLCLLLLPVPARAERIKDLARLEGARGNQLLGYGLVVGLSQTGDDFYSGIGMQSVATMLRHLGVNVDPNQLRLRNVAAVMVTAEMPAFVTPGQRLDVTVASIGDARSLEGGTLIASPLKGLDKQVYAVAQGALAVGGYYVGGLSGSSIRRNVTTIGRVPNGAVVEREVTMQWPKDVISLKLNAPDFTTAVRIAKAIEAKLSAPAAAASPAAEAPVTPEGDVVQDANAAKRTPARVTLRDAGSVEIQIPPEYADRLPVLVADLEDLDVQPDYPNRVVVNERTGTVVLGDGVRLTPVAIAHGGLTLQVNEMPVVSQPGAFSRGQTTVTPMTNVNAQENMMPMAALNPGPSLGEVVKALNTLGVTPRDLVAILQALKAAGALRAELEIL